MNLAQNGRRSVKEKKKAMRIWLEWQRRKKTSK